MSLTRLQPSSGRYIYIAQELREGVVGFKVGKSRQLLKNRERGLRGQTSVPLKMLRTFDTLDEDLAEVLAFEVFDKSNWRTHPGTRLEQFENCTIDELSAVIVAACKVADKDYEKSGRAAYDKPLTVSSTPTLRAGTPIVRKLLEGHLLHAGRRVTLGQYLDLAVQDGRLFKRLEKLGIRHLATTLKTVDLEVFWQHDSGPLAWLRTTGVKLPSVSVTRFQLKRIANG